MLQEFKLFMIENVCCQDVNTITFDYEGLKIRIVRVINSAWGVSIRVTVDDVMWHDCLSSKADWVAWEALLNIELVQREDRHADVRRRFKEALDA